MCCADEITPSIFFTPHKLCDALSQFLCGSLHRNFVLRRKKTLTNRKKITFNYQHIFVITVVSVLSDSIREKMFGKIAIKIRNDWKFNHMHIKYPLHTFLYHSHLNLLFDQKNLYICLMRSIRTCASVEYAAPHQWKHSMKDRDKYLTRRISIIDFVSLL